MTKSEVDKLSHGLYYVRDIYEEENEWRYIFVTSLPQGQKVFIPLDTERGYFSGFWNGIMNAEHVSWLAVLLTEPLPPVCDGFYFSYDQEESK